MKRPIKPFVVEVRKGQKAQTKKAPVVELPPMALFEEQPRENDALRRAEAAAWQPAKPNKLPKPKPKPGAVAGVAGAAAGIATDVYKSGCAAAGESFSEAAAVCLQGSEDDRRRRIGGGGTRGAQVDGAF